MWCGESICQARSDTDRVTRRFFEHGVHYPTMGTGVGLYYGQDQLGSVRDLSLVSTGARVGTFDYDAYGDVTVRSARIYPEFGHARLFHHGLSGLRLAKHRVYDAGDGRWTSRDPLGEEGGLNLYGYVEAGPVRHIDPSGRAVQICKRAINIDWVGGANAYLPSHHWIRTDTVEAGMGGECPIPGQGCSGKPGLRTQTIGHTGQGNATGSVCVTVPDVDEQCVNNAIAPGRATGRWMPWNQCQSFVRDTLYNCSTLGPTTPYIGFPNVGLRKRRP